MKINSLLPRLTSTSLKVNMISSGVFWFINILSSFILIRVILTYVKLSAYGYWAAFLALTSYITLSDLGLGPTITKYISDTRINPDKKQILVTFITILEFLGALLLSLGFIIFYFYFYRPNYLTVFIFILVGQFFIQMGMNFLAILNGLQKILLGNVLLIIKTLVYFSFTLILVKTHALMGMATSFIISGFVFLLTSGTAVYFYFKPNFTQIKSIDKKFINRVLNFSKSMFYLKIVGQSRNQFDRIILSIVSSPELTAIVDLAKKLINPIRGIYVALISPVFPVFSQYYSQNDNQSLNRVFKKILITASLVLILAFAGLAIISHKLVILWLGPSFLAILPATYILIVSEFLNLITFPVNLKIIASGDHGLLVKFSIIVVSLQISASLIALYYFNYLVMLSVFAGIEFIKVLIWIKLFKHHLTSITTKIKPTEN